MDHRRRRLSAVVSPVLVGTRDRLLAGAIRRRRLRQLRLACRLAGTLGPCCMLEAFCLFVLTCSFPTREVLPTPQSITIVITITIAITIFHYIHCNLHDKQDHLR